MIHLVTWLLRWTGLSSKDRDILFKEVMHSLDIPPLRAIISTDENRRILVNGKPLEPDQALLLRESARTTLDSFARKVVQEQVRFKAVDEGFLKSNDLETGKFYKSALWYAQEENELLRILAQDSTL